METLGETLLDVSGVDQAYRVGFLLRRAEVLHDVSFQVPSNSIFGLLGANGAGKTTLIKLVVGLHRPKRGTITIAGVPSFYLESKSRVGYLPERPYFHEHLTGEKLLYYMGRLSGMSEAQIAKRIPEVLPLVSMSHAGNTELRRYSKGMLQRIGIAQAILHDPDLLVFDEPMSGLDPLGRKEMRDLMVRLRSEGKTVFFSTHIMQDAEAVCDEIAVIEKGKLLWTGKVASFLKEGEHPTEVVVSGFQAGSLPGNLGGLESETVPMGLRLLVPSETQVNSVVESVIQSGGSVVSVTPQRPTLDSFFKKGEA